MKNHVILLLIIFFANASFSQDKSYDQLWRAVEFEEVNGLPKSALKIVETIEAKATADNNEPQQIKVLLFKSKFALILKEDAQLQIVNAFKAKIKTSTAPTKNILENVLANLYWQYFKAHRYQFYNRTKTEEKVDAEDFRTWDLTTLIEDIQLHFDNSLQNESLLQQTDLNNYNILLDRKKDSKLYRPTLFDFLSHNALDFYKASEARITKPADNFRIDDPNYFSDAETFSRLSIQSTDSLSSQLKALKIYQKLIQFHLNKPDKTALTDVNISRLHYVYANTVVADKENLLIDSFKKESDKNTGTESEAQYDYEIAHLLYKQGLQYDSNTNADVRWKIKDAVELCEFVIKKHPETNSAEHCALLKQRILSRSLGIQTESNLPINKNAKLLVTYKNIEQLEFSAYALSEKEITSFNDLHKIEEQKAFIGKLSATKTWKTPLIDEGDYQSHTIEILAPKLDNGRYLIVGAAENDGIDIAHSLVQVTNTAYIEYHDHEFKVFQFIDRNNGQPLTQVEVTITYEDKKSKKTITTDAYGKIRVKDKTDRYGSFSLTVANGTDTAVFKNLYLRGYYPKNMPEKTSYKSFLFTDRSIYRPGQTVFFKGIIIDVDRNRSLVVSDYKTSAKLIDVNGKELSNLELITNDYGSISGEFILPNTGLTGPFAIRLQEQNEKYTINSQTIFSVEEYKRPKFKTTFKSLTETIKVNDSVTVKGEALAFAGSTITDAKVVYRVKRNIQYAPWFYRSRYAPQQPEQEIAHGETTTNNKGEYSIPFKAIPDANVDKKGLPIFSYEITADVTDINGETQSASTFIKAGYHTITAALSIADQLEKSNKKHTLQLTTKNLNDEFISTTGSLKIYKLQAPDHVLRPRPWEAPDYQNFTKEDFKTLFPHEAYTNEDHIENREKGALVFEKTVTTDSLTDISLGNIKRWDSGAYIITFETKDPSGLTVKDEIKISVYGNNDTVLADNQLFSITTNKIEYALNDTAEITLATAAEDLVINVDIEKDHKIIKSYTVPLLANKKTISVPVTANDYGGFVVHVSYAAFNSFYSSSLRINVPYPKSELEIETLTFRDKLQPGSDETWSFKIKGPQGEKVSAELLASMYDASLDQFKKHQWQFSPLYQPQYYSQSRRSGYSSFFNSNFKVQLNQLYNYFPSPKNYDSLNWFGLHIGNENQYKYYLRDLQSRRRQMPTFDKVISGIVLDENGLPLPGVNIIVEGTIYGTQTDFDGHYSLKVKQESQVFYSFVGYVTEKKPITSQTIYNLSMADDDNVEQVVISALGIKRNRPELTYAIGFSDQKADIQGAPMEEEDSYEVAEKHITEDKQDATNNDFSNVQIRKNLQETAFFFPQLETDKDGTISFNFTTPEALTQWKLQLLAHTKTLESSIKTLDAVTQKELMVIPNAPRFLREGDRITISTKIVNLTNKELNGTAVLQLFDAVTNNPIDAQLNNSNSKRAFTVAEKGNTQVSWQLTIPKNIQAVTYKILAQSGNYSDGEQNVLPVLTNRMLVTETLPMWISSNETKTFTLDKLKTTTSPTLKHHKLTLEITSNPAWYAVQALPYVMDYPYDCNEQIFSRYYANSLAHSIVSSNPKIKRVFNQWKSHDGLLSTLEKNPELKSILIEETPWLRDAESKTEQKKRIALLFDFNTMTNGLSKAIRKLENNQMDSGAWSWFGQYRENRFITQHIISGFGHLKTLGVNTESNSKMISKAIGYLDTQFVKEYNDLTKHSANVDVSADHLSYSQLQYLYMRSFFKDVKTTKEVRKIMDYYQSQINAYWLQRSLYAKGMMGLISNRNGDKATAHQILESLRETSITSEELGMYWKENTSSWQWYEAPIETQSLLIEAFSEIEETSVRKTGTIDNLKIWLLKNKQTNSWKTTKATTNAVYALLLQSSDWLSVTDSVEVSIGGQPLSPETLENVKVEAGTGYYKTSWNTTEIKPELADVTLTKKGNGIAWAGLYWQYFEDLEAITFAETPLKLQKKLFKKTQTDTGELLTDITKNTTLNVGDAIRVRIEIRSDRAMEFVHLKDMRASGLEPINVLSQYKHQDGLGYYESTKDTATHFFFDYLPKGIYVFEYDLRVTNAGEMSNGITTIQSMYAPEFTSHSEGIRITTKE
ncbi:alpha-2-macroglobulin [Bizionia saleffrena]|uniref:Alpha-2-macroglobulin n=1 Tax=Bizionia saleffrena TaxID=291189 RepID=A0A8H2LGD5_9FLAO|nr:MG2 domain-containing protein [Bizionia saleffrena]TYB73893.1 alpha-2-macroglobulin [Bizionia saleffrena]